MTCGSHLGLKDYRSCCQTREQPRRRKPTLQIRMHYLPFFSPSIDRRHKTTPRPQADQTSTAKPNVRFRTHCYHMSARTGVGWTLCLGGWGPGFRPLKQQSSLSCGSTGRGQSLTEPLWGSEGSFEGNLSPQPLLHSSNTDVHKKNI